MTGRHCHHLLHLHLHLNPFSYPPSVVLQRMDHRNLLPLLGVWMPPDGSFAALGRATPDVAALGEGYKVYQGGRVIAVDGTSAATPTFAALVSLLNEARFKAGLPQMGFLNPFLYANPDAFFDVVKGTNAIGRGTGNLTYGFACAKGWDPATGIGTPHFDKLLAAALKAATAGVVEEA